MTLSVVVSMTTTLQSGVRETCVGVHPRRPASKAVPASVAADRDRIDEMIALPLEHRRIPQIPRESAQRLPRNKDRY